jgi:hypothetical protein
MTSPAFRYNSTGTYSQSKARSGAYYVRLDGKALGIVKRLSDNTWVARAGTGPVSPPQSTRTAAAEWLRDQPTKETTDARS